MSELSILFFLYVIISFTVIGFALGKALGNHTKYMADEFETKMALADAQSKSKATDTFENIRKNIDFIIGFYVFHEVSMTLENEEVGKDDYSNILKQSIAIVSANTMAAISDETKRQFSMYATVESLEYKEGAEDFLTYYIRKTATTMITKLITIKENK